MAKPSSVVCVAVRRSVAALALAALSLVAAPAHAWSNHALCTWPALAALPEFTALPPAPAESLASFLKAEASGLQKLLDDEEAWAQRHVPNYPARPAALAFRADPSLSADELQRRFIAALRINPASKLPLFLQLRPGQGGAGRAALTEADVTPLKTKESSKFDAFVALREGEPVPVIDIVASATDEPDYGLDIGIWSDNGTPHGAAYGFGKQPFGNPKVEFSSQAPMHIGFFHESAIVYKAAPFLGRTFPEYRVHLWRSLAAYALKTGHPYWGWRFAGWALHYLQDLTQPYHARVLPGISTARMLGINTLDIVGVKGPKERAITFVSNRHFALENYQLRWLRAAHLSGRDDDLAFRALRDTALDAGAPYRDDSPRQAIAKASHEASDATDAAVVAALPPKYTSDPDYTFGVTETGLDLRAELAKASPAAVAPMEQALLPLLRQFGLHTRSFVRGLLAAR
ncbi:phospholipase [Aquincola sp. S2]|uniref:Phospholipase n=1 Tax=Pseudaquabacterium terrae TaxID=2732868 RepID=A0ABX2EE91_9BURK|nr:phospholipase [Aquabacterium terrae]NRF66922.1 phospholipase [Aquabacterium terrae]